MHLLAAEDRAFDAATDEALALRAPGDFDAATELYNRYIYPVYRFVRSQVPNDQVAEDVTAHVFFKAFSRSETFRGNGSYRAWLYRIARNCISSWRTSAERAAIVVDELPDFVDESQSPASAAISKQERRFIWRVVAQLPPAQREVVALHYLKDLTIEEISVATHRSRGAIRVLLHRARTKLRAAFDRAGSR